MSYFSYGSHYYKTAASAAAPLSGKRRWGLIGSFIIGFVLAGTIAKRMIEF